MGSHLVSCYRESVKCKSCGEVIPRASRKQHLSHWRTLPRLRQSILSRDSLTTALFFAHGVAPQVQVCAESREWPVHLAARVGSVPILLDLVGRCSEVDPRDAKGNTPLHLAVLCD